MHLLVSVCLVMSLCVGSFARPETANTSATVGQEEREGSVRFYSIDKPQYEAILKLTEGKQVISEARLIGGGYRSVSGSLNSLGRDLSASWRSLLHAVGLSNGDSKSANAPQIDGQPLCIIKTNEPAADSLPAEADNSNQTAINCIVVVKQDTANATVADSAQLEQLLPSPVPEHNEPTSEVPLTTVEQSQTPAAPQSIVVTELPIAADVAVVTTSTTKTPSHIGPQVKRLSADRKKQTNSQQPALGQGKQASQPVAAVRQSGLAVPYPYPYAGYGYGYNAINPYAQYAQQYGPPQYVPQLGLPYVPQYGQQLAPIGQQYYGQGVFPYGLISYYDKPPQAAAAIDEDSSEEADVDEHEFEPARDVYQYVYQSAYEVDGDDESDSNDY